MKDVLTKEELSTFFNACENYIVYRTIFIMIYGSELRILEGYMFLNQEGKPLKAERSIEIHCNEIM